MTIKKRLQLLRQKMPEKSNYRSFHIKELIC